MADREAKVTFRAETEQFQAQVKAANQAMSGLRSEMKLNDAQFSNTGDRADYLRGKSQILSSQLDANKQKQEALRAELEVARRVYGEDSSEVANLERQLNYAAAQEQALQSQLSATNAELSASETATGQLTSTISDQERELEELKQAYVEAALSKGEDSDEARELAGEIENLSGELKENKSDLANAEKAADDLDQSMGEAEKSADDLGGSFDSLSVAAGNLVADGLERVIDAMVDVAKESVQTGRDFEDSMARVQALSGATDEELQMLSSTAQELGAATVYSSSEAADALGYMALAGWDANQSAGALGGVLDLAASSGMSLAQASDIVTDYMSAFGLECEQSGYFADVLSYAQANANTTVEGLGQAFQNCSANMAAAGQDVETTTALLSMMANQGLKGSRAGTALSAVMRDMTAKMEDGAIAIGDTSVEVMDAEGNYRDLTDILADVEAATDGMGDAEKASALSATFTADSIKGLNLLLNAGTDEAAAFEEELRASSGTAAEMGEVMTDNLSGDLMDLDGSIEVLQLSLYDKLEPAMRDGVTWVSGLVDSVSSAIDVVWEVVGASPALQAAIVAVAVVIGVLVAALAINSLIQTVTTAFSGLFMVLAANPIVLIVALIAGLVAAIVYAWNNCEGFRTAVIGIWDAIKNAISTAINAVATVIGTVMAAISSVWSTVWGVVSTTVFNVWNGIRNAISTAINAAHTVVSGVIGAISSTLSNGFNAAKTAVTNVFNGIRDAIMTPINAARDAVSGAIDTIKDVVNNAKLSLPHFKLPHFNIDGGELPWGIGGKGKKPSISIDWYAAGGILTAPTIFGWDGASFLGGGEAGPEAVLPIDALQGYIDAAMERHSGGGELLRLARDVERLEARLPSIIADNAPDSWPGDHAFKTAIRKVAA